MQVKDIYINLQYTDFANYYTNDFDFVFNWQNTINYVIADKVAQLDTKNYKYKIFSAKTNNINKEPLLNVSDWDFVGLQANANEILQSDIERQLAIAKEMFPYHLFNVENENTILQYFYLLVAFLIVSEKSRINSGIVSTAKRLTSSVSVGVGSVSESFDGGNLETQKEWFYQNSYGQQYYNFIYSLAQTQILQYVSFC